MWFQERKRRRGLPRAVVGLQDRGVWCLPTSLLPKLEELGCLDLGSLSRGPDSTTVCEGSSGFLACFSRWVLRVLPGSECAPWDTSGTATIVVITVIVTHVSNGTALNAHAARTAWLVPALSCKAPNEEELQKGPHQVGISRLVHKLSTAAAGNVF